MKKYSIYYRNRMHEDISHQVFDCNHISIEEDGSLVIKDGGGEVIAAFSSRCWLKAIKEVD